MNREQKKERKKRRRDGNRKIKKEIRTKCKTGRIEAPWGYYEQVIRKLEK